MALPFIAVTEKTLLLQVKTISACHAGLAGSPLFCRRPGSRRSSHLTPRDILQPIVQSGPAPHRNPISRQRSQWPPPPTTSARLLLDIVQKTVLFLETQDVQKERALAIFWEGNLSRETPSSASRGIEHGRLPPTNWQSPFSLRRYAGSWDVGDDQWYHIHDEQPDAVEESDVQNSKKTLKDYYDHGIHRRLPYRRRSSQDLDYSVPLALNIWIQATPQLQLHVLLPAADCLSLSAAVSKTVGSADS